MIYGLVSEFNPFHNGHKWLIDKVKTENDTVVTVMSSSFVQRGDISIISKMDRTFASLKNGVDLVLELPSVYSLSSAEDFGKSSIEILKGTNIIDKVVFGSECGDVDLLKKGISALKDKNVQNISVRLPRWLFCAARFRSVTDRRQEQNLPSVDLPQHTGTGYLFLLRLPCAVLHFPPLSDGDYTGRAASSFCSAPVSISRSCWCMHWLPLWVRPWIWA